jgi:DNA polymerase-1
MEKTDGRSRIHTNYKLFGTVTGRLSSEKPNLQQVPREGTMRTCFGAPPGYLFLEADYSQVELRIAAMLAHETTLLRIFATGGDPHLTTAAEISGLTPQQVLESDAAGGTEHRKKAKPVNFGFLYGMGEPKFITYARDNYGVVVSEEDAHEYREKYFRLYPKLLNWHDRQRRLVRRYGRVHSPIGRVRHLPDVFSGDKGVAAEAERQAINSPVQSLASDMMIMAMIRLSGMLRRPQALIVATVHDMIGFQIREDYIEEATPLIRSTMQDMRPLKKLFGANITVPIEVEIKVGTHWGAGKVVK